MALLRSCPFSPSATQPIRKGCRRSLPQRPPSIASLRGLFVSSKFDVQVVSTPLAGLSLSPRATSWGRSAVTRRNTSAACRVDEVCKKQLRGDMPSYSIRRFLEQALPRASQVPHHARFALALVDDENLAFVP